MDDDLRRHLDAIHKDVKQANMRLAKVTRAIAAKDGPPGGDVSAVLFDFLDDIERAAASTSDPSLRAGLDVAIRALVERLARLGWRPAPNDGAVDPHLHQVVRTESTDDPSLDRHIAHVQSRGWVRPDDSVARTARVVAYKLDGDRA